MTRRLLFVVGKGGVGRTSVAAGLALAAGRAGKKALVIELNGVWDIGRRFGLSPSYEPRALAPRVKWRSLTARDCMKEFGRRKLKLGMVGSRVMGSRPMQAFVDAVPGLPDLLQLGKIENLIWEPLRGDEVYDLVVVDAPATGHGLTLLSAPQSMTEITGSGPFHDLARRIAVALASEETGVVVTTLPEALPLSETFGLLDELETMNVDTDRIVVNRVSPAPLPDLSVWPLVRQSLMESDLAPLVDLTESVLAAHAEETSVRQRLHERAGTIPVVEIPRLPEVRTNLGAIAASLEGTP